MIKIYHNARCSKSREGLSFLKDLNKDFEVVNYLEHPFNFNELKALIILLKIQPIELVRTKETIWKEQYKNHNLSDDEIIEIMVQNPKLIERPIVVNNDKAVIARPTELINSVL